MGARRSSAGSFFVFSSTRAAGISPAEVKVLFRAHRAASEGGFFGKDSAGTPGNDDWGKSGLLSSEFRAAAEKNGDHRPFTKKTHGHDAKKAKCRMCVRNVPGTSYAG